MFFYTSIIALLVLAFVYEWIIRMERKEHRAEVQRVLERAEAERSNLYDRIMSGSIHQYQSATSDKPKVKKSTNFFKSKLDETDRLRDE